MISIRRFSIAMACVVLGVPAVAQSQAAQQ
jgi:hypothetical protein